MLARIRAAAREITGREVSAAESGRWLELADLLMTELKIAAGRTTVSSVPAFLTEHLRRRLWKREKTQLEGDIGTPPSLLVTHHSSPKIDASKCPDCFGTGLWYPGGFDKGVAKCGHEKLGKAE